MKKPTVRLKIRIRLANGDRPFAKPVFASNGKLKPLYALVEGKPEHHPEGVYFLRYLRGEKRVWESVGSDPQLALVAKLKRERYIEAKDAGLIVMDDGAGESRPIKESVEEYLSEVRDHKARKTYLGYAKALNLFLECYKKTGLEEIERKDLIAYMAYLKSKGNAPRTVANRVRDVKVFLLNRGLLCPLLKSDKPRYTEKVVSAYSREEMRQLMDAASVDERDLFQFLLCTGAREQEVQFATWRDVSFNQKTFAVREKLDLGFTPKDKEEGEIPIPDSLVDLLRKRRARFPEQRLIFPGATGKPDGHLLRILKRVALAAGLNCGHCYNKRNLCCAQHPVCDRWELHRFRKTFATWHSENGVPVRTIQRWLRHSDLETTLRYLAGSDDKSIRTREQVNNTFADIAGAA